METTDITPVLLDCRRRFIVLDRDGRKRGSYMLYQPTLGMMQAAAALLPQLGIDARLMSKNPVLECLRLAYTCKSECCMLLQAYMIDPRDWVSQWGDSLIHDFLKRQASEQDIAVLLLIVLQDSKLMQYMKILGIIKERERMERVQKAKNNANTYIFGGKSIYGSLLATACEKFGWTYDYVMWGISYNNLQLMLADSVQSIYLTDEERKNAHIPAANAKQIKVTADNIEQIKAMFK